MPTIAAFYGIFIQMFFNDHNPPHLHARYGGANALVRLSDGEVFRGELPPIAARMVHDWVLAHQPELNENWRRVSNGLLPEKIGGPDGYQ